MQNFQDTFETRKRLFISVFSICMTVPLTKVAIQCRYAPGYFTNTIRTTFYQTIVIHKLSYFEKQSLTKKVFLKVSQSSQESTCVGASFLIKLQV